MKTFLLALVLVFSYVVSAAQDHPSSKVLVFSGSTLNFAHTGSRDLNTNANLNRGQNWDLGTGVMYGNWKTTTLLYYGISFGFSGNSNMNGVRTSGFYLAPTVGLMKKFPISSAVYLIPSAEYRLGFSWSNNTSNGVTESNPVTFTTGVTAYPLSLGVTATRKLDVILTVGSLGLWYSRTTTNGDPVLGYPRLGISSVYLNGQLNSLGVGFF